MGSQGRETVRSPQVEHRCPACGEPVGTVIKRRKTLGAYVPVWEPGPCRNPDCARSDASQSAKSPEKSPEKSGEKSGGEPGGEPAEKSAGESGDEPGGESGGAVGAP
ncbi:hypothetical protein ACFYWY_03250 [Streptomyces sp. NPDC002870]|uniref:hypothetical protein n=1 Tax=Streptomyces sp. NPDC002870 TaxID=3364666 RepID=UPI0036B596D5